jgi:hypothetical protein
VVDIYGVPVADSAYPALALGIIATMLIVGSFWGRAGGLSLLGFIAALGTAAATASDYFPDEVRSYAPTSAADVRDSYEFGGGRFTLDLSDVSDVDAVPDQGGQTSRLRVLDDLGQEAGLADSGIPAE